MGIRVVVTGADAGQAVWNHLDSLPSGRTVIFVSLLRPQDQVRPHIDEAAWIIDAITCTSGVPPPQVDHTMFLQSPTMLEMLAMRVEQLAGRVENAHVVIDNLNAACMYNGLGPTQEFVHYIGNRLRGHGVPMDLLLREGSDAEALKAGLKSFVDGVDALA